MKNGDAPPVETHASLPAGLPLDPALHARCFPDRTANPDHLRLGDTCPAIVLQRDPWLIAVATDLNCQGDAGQPCPVIAIVSQPLDLMTGGPPPVGSRLATAALYHGDGHAARWLSFHPLVAGCVSSDSAAIDRALRSIPGEQWASFLDSLPTIEPPYRAESQYVLKSWRNVGATRAAAAGPIREGGTLPDPRPAAPATHRASLGVLVFVLIILGGLGAALVNEYRNVWSVAGAAPFWGAALWLIWTIGRQRVDLSRYGIEWTDKGRTKKARWGDVNAYTVSASIGRGGLQGGLANVVVAIQERRHQRFSKATTAVVVTLEFQDGRRLALHQTYARAFELFESVLDQVDPRLAAGMRAAVERGESVPCGKGIALAPFGLVTPGRVWAWDEIDDATAMDGGVTVVAGGSHHGLDRAHSPFAVAAAIRALRLRPG